MVDTVHFFALACAIVLLGCNWIIGDQSTLTKIVLTAVYLLGWLLLYVGFWAVSAAHAAFAVVVGTMTFGIDWMMRQR
jgi:hypothetical protein